MKTIVLLVALMVSVTVSGYARKDSNKHAVLVKHHTVTVHNNRLVHNRTWVVHNRATNRTMVVHHRRLEHPLAARALAARRLEMAHNKGMACKLSDVAIIAAPATPELTVSTAAALPVCNVIRTGNGLVRECPSVSTDINGNLQISRESSFLGYSPDQTMTDVNVIQTGYNENVKVKNKDWGVKVKEKGFSPEYSYSYSTTSAMPALNQGMTNTEVISTAGLCKVYQDGNTLISKCPATNCATNCNIVTPAPAVNIEREATFLGYFPKTCDNMAAAPLPEPAPAPVVVEENVEPMAAPAPVEESCHRGCHKNKCATRCNNNYYNNNSCHRCSY